jgi:magnesium chelatase family protein
LSKRSKRPKFGHYRKYIRFPPLFFTFIKAKRGLDPIIKVGVCMFVYSYIRYGFDGILVRIEADLSRGIPGVDITGLASGAVREARERVRSAFRHSEFRFPLERVLINLAPAEIKKEDAALDLPIALSMLAASGQIPSACNVMALGELELSGRLRPVRGVLAAAARALSEGIDSLVVPQENVREAAILMPGRAAGAATLKEAAALFAYREQHGCFPAAAAGQTGGAPKARAAFGGDFSEIRGQGRYKRVLEIAAAGGHNVLVFGPPGAGKTMLARRWTTVFPDLAPDDAVTVTRLYSLAGILCGDDPETPNGMITRPPLRAPHHTASAEGILGGGKHLHPGEASLAHAGALFLDEAPQFHRNVLQALREPLEEKRIRISRAGGQVELPADFQLLLAANPCPCGKLGAAAGDCFCSGEEIARYWRKFGGALLDRVELRVAVSAPDIDTLSAGPAGESSAVIRGRVEQALAAAGQRFARSRIRRNAAMPPSFIDTYCATDAGARKALKAAVEKLGVSGRAYHGILRVARTIADLEGKDGIGAEHVLEAVQHRRHGDDPYDVFNA